MNRTLVSVILPFRNSLFLERAIDSILNQSYQYFELLLINNDSNEKDVSIAEYFIKKDPRVKMFFEPQVGVVFAMNAGIKNAEGKFIARMDADDLSLSNRLEDQVTFLELNSMIDFVGGLVTYQGPKENIGFQHFVNWQNTIISHDQIVQNQFVEFPLVNPSLLFRKSVFEERLFLEGSFPEDYEFFLYLISVGKQGAKIDRKVLIWQDSPSRLTRVDPRYTKDSFFQVKAKYLSSWLRKVNRFYPQVYICGGGRIARKRAALLTKYGIEIQQYIDFSSGNQQISYQELPKPGMCFVLSYVANRDAREKIRTFLLQAGYMEGQDFLIVA